MEIDVYNESIGATFTEYLVNMEYLEKICSKHGLTLLESNSFETLLTSEASKYGKTKDINDNLKKYSFMNNYFVFEKTGSKD